MFNNFLMSLYKTLRIEALNYCLLRPVIMYMFAYKFIVFIPIEFRLKEHLYKVWDGWP
jgi:hypothetical protein